MAQNPSNPTVFQKLTKMFGFPGQVKQTNAPSFNFNKDLFLDLERYTVGVPLDSLFVCYLLQCQIRN